MAGRPRTETSFRDDTVSAFQLGSAKFVVQVITERGKANVPKEIRNEQQFIREFGNVIHQTGEEAVRALRQGAILIVNPLHKLNAGVPVGTKASIAITVGAETLTVTAEEVGEGYNGTTLYFSKPQSRRAGFLDLRVYKGNEFTESISDVPVSLTAEQVIILNEKLQRVVLSISGTVTLTESVTGTLASGVKDFSTILPVDVITSLNATFQDYDFGDVFHIVNLYYADFEVDAAFVIFSQIHRLSCHLPLPLNASVSDMIDQRNGTGSFSHNPIDAMEAEYWAGQIKVRSIQDNTRIIEIHGMSDVMAAISRKDQEGVWISASASRFGKFASDVLDARKFTNDELNQLSDAGMNYISRISGQGIKTNGNNSLYRDATKTVSKRTIADLTLYNMRWTKVNGDKFLHEPTDVPMFKAMHKSALPTIMDLIQRRAITSDYVWLGDQNAENLSDDELKNNTVAECQQGLYYVAFYITPIGSTEQIRIEIVNTQGAQSAVSAIV